MGLRALPGRCARRHAYGSRCWRRRSGACAAKLKQYVRAKCLAVLLNFHINGYDAVLLNVYQMFLYVAMKFHCLLESRRDFAISNVDFLFRAIAVDLAGYAVSLVHSASSQTVCYLVLYAFWTILSKRSSHDYDALVVRLATLLDTAPSYLRVDLARIVDWKRSAVFDHILF